MNANISLANVFMPVYKEQQVTRSPTSFGGFGQGAQSDGKSDAKA